MCALSVLMRRIKNILICGIVFFSVVLFKCSILNSGSLFYTQTISSMNTGNSRPSREAGGTGENDTYTTGCKPKTNIAFLKVHKTGSSTILNIIARYVFKHDLNIAAPRKSEGYGFNYIGYRRTIYEDNIVPIPENEEYNVICNHVVYNRDAFRKIVPNNTVYLGIVRNPETHFLSALNFYMVFNRIQRLFPGSQHPLTDFLTSPSLYSPQMGSNVHYIHNRMSYDFGLPVQKFYDEKYTADYFKQLEEDFDLVMITEYFDESVIFLRRLLCLELKDVLYISINSGSYPGEVTLSELEKELLRTWNVADFKLYDIFKKKFLIKLNEQDSDFFGEVEHFRTTRARIEQFCLSDLPPSIKSFFIPRSNWNEDIDFRLTDCFLMHTESIGMDKLIILRAWEKYEGNKLKGLRNS